MEKGGNKMIEFDKGPNKQFTQIFNDAPDYKPFKENFWYDWGPVYYRGRLDGSARVLGIASDPGPPERVACRTLVGDAGQRTQGFLTKLGLTRSYILVNAFLYALHPSHFNEGKNVLKDPQQTAWRNKLFNQLKTPKIQAIIAFGAMAQLAVDLWPDKGPIPVFKVQHPSFREEDVLLESWRNAIPPLRQIVTPDKDGNPTLPNYGTDFLEVDYAPIPKRDLPFGVPPCMGDDSWGRKATPRHNNGVERPGPDDEHTLIWIVPQSSTPA
jgi:hypothetical protein